MITDNELSQLLDLDLAVELTAWAHVVRDQQMDGRDFHAALLADRDQGIEASSAVWLTARIARHDPEGWSPTVLADRLALFAAELRAHRVSSSNHLK